MPLSLDALPLDARTRLLVVAPHPDDETIATGELIQHVRAARGNVHVLLLTSGDDNPWPQRWLERRLWIGDAERERWGRRRRAEFRQALQTLGLGPDDFHMLGWRDMGVTGRLRRQYEASVQTMVTHLQQYRPNLVALPALSDRHPDHGTAYVLLRLALARVGGTPPSLLSYLIHGRSNQPGCIVELPPAPALHAVKLAALRAHASQMALSASRMRRMTDRPERYTEVASAVGDGAQVLPWRPPRRWQRWLQLMVVDGAGVRCWPWLQAPLRRGDDGRYCLEGEVAGARANGPRFARLSLDVSSPWIFDRWGWCEL